MKKWIAFACVLSLVLCLAGCREDAVLPEVKVYQTGGSIHSLNIQINAADFNIRQGEDFRVESNLKYLSVSDENGVLSIQEKVNGSKTYINAMLTLYVPEGTVFHDVKIITGAARLTVDILSALTINKLEFQLGAGDVKIGNLNAANEVDIEGGAGQVTIASGTLNNLELEMGVGELNLTAALLGNCDLFFGVGESNLTLVGSKDHYSVELEKGIGSIRVDGVTVTNFAPIGTGPNDVEIEGGIGEINLNFQKMDVL